MTKSTAIAPSNIAFTKYWGRKDNKLRLPINGSIAMCLSNLLTTTTVEFSSNFTKDEIVINNTSNENEIFKVKAQLDRVRKIAGISDFARVVSKNNFPTGTGLSSSASGFAALTLAATKASGLSLSEKDLSILAREGSGSASRSIPSGIVEWLDGSTSETSFSKTIFDKDYWDIADVVAVVSKSKKEVPTSEAHQAANTSPFLKTRVARMKEKNEYLTELIKKKEFTKFGELIESEALELHAIYITQSPPLIYLLPNSISLMKFVQKWRREGLECYFTVNTGQDVHIIVQQKDIPKIKKKLERIKEVNEIIVNKPSDGAKLSSKHLF